MDTITSLALGQVRQHKKRSMVIAAAIILTTILFTAIISIAASIMQFTSLTRMLATGSNYHADLGENLFSIKDYELLDRVRACTDVESATLVARYGSAGYTDNVSDNNRAMSILYAFSDEDVLEHLFVELLEGRFPENANEVLLNRELYPDMAIGDKITVTDEYVRSDKPLIESFSKEFTVCGFITGYTDYQYPILAKYDPEFADSIFADAKLYVYFDNDINAAGKVDAMLAELSDIVVGDGSDSVHINEAYLVSSLDSLANPTLIVTVLIAVAVVFFAAFLLIHNIYSIALTQDMQTFGLLGVIGMTYRQTQRMILIQSLVLYAASIPVGLLSGYIIGFRLLMPVFMSMIGDLLPYTFGLGTAMAAIILTLATLLFSALTPLRRIRRLSPIQAVSASEENQARRRRRRGRSRSASPFMLAISAMARSPRKHIITALSAALSILVFVFVGSLSEGMIGSTMQHMQEADFVCQLAYDSRYGKAAASLSGLSVDPTLPEKVAAIEGITNVSCVKYAEITFRGTQYIAELAKEEIARDSEYSPNASKANLDAAAGSPHAFVVGVPDELCPYIITGQDEYGRNLYYGDAAELYDGEHILSVVCRIRSFSDNEIITRIHLKSGELLQSADMKKSYTAIACGDSYATALSKAVTTINYDTECAFFILPLSVFEQEFPDAKIYAITADAVDDGIEVAVRQQLDALMAECELITDGTLNIDMTERKYYHTVDGRMDTLQTMNERLSAINITGYSLCILVFITGIVNMINSAMTSVLLRRREYAMLEAVGMTGGQIKAMMLWENASVAVFAALALIISLPAAEWLLLESFGVEANIHAAAALAMLAVMIAASIVTALAAYRLLTTASVTERIRNE